MDWNMARHADGSDIFVKSHLESLEGKHKFASDSSARNSISLKKVFNQKINKIKKIGQPLLLFFSPLLFLLFSLLHHVTSCRSNNLPDEFIRLIECGFLQVPKDLLEKLTLFVDHHNSNDPIHQINTHTHKD